MTALEDSCQCQLPPRRGGQAMEELDEVEVLWPEYYACHTQADDDHKPPLPAAVASMPMSRPSRQRCAALSRPVDVPSRGPMLVIRWKHGSTEDDLEIDRGGNNKMVVPPHLLVSGRESAPVAPYASLRSGRQRQRARDLRHLRNSVLRMTGFIEG